jgi:hypothetical protein
MLRTNRQRREVEALEKIARASTRMANAAGRIAEHEKEKTGFLKWSSGFSVLRRHRRTLHLGAAMAAMVGCALPQICRLFCPSGRMVATHSRPASVPVSM